MFSLQLRETMLFLNLLMHAVGVANNEMGDEG